MDSYALLTFKYILLAFNVVFAFAGLGIIATGAIVFYNMGSYDHFLDNKITIPPIILMAAGILVFTIAFIGSYGILVESVAITMTFATILGIVFILEMASGIAACVYKDEFGDYMRTSLKSTMVNSTDADKAAWNTIQQELECCGVDSGQDWLDIMKKDRTDDKEFLPKSCCRGTGMDFPCEKKSIHVYQDGCYALFEATVTVNAQVLAGVGITIAILEVVGTVLSCYLATAIKEVIAHDIAK